MVAVQMLNRWFGVGHSTAPDAATACAEATASALTGRDAAILFVFTSLREDLSAIVEAARAGIGPGTMIVGGTTFGEITPSGPTSNGVVAFALGGTGNHCAYRGQPKRRRAPARSRDRGRSGGRSRRPPP
jgi:hypothetical protein